MTWCTPPTWVILLTWGGGGGDARGVVISCWDDGDEDVEDDKEQDRGGVVKFKLAVFLVRGGGFGNKRIFIESFLIDVEVDKFAANTAEEQVDESDESDWNDAAAVVAFLLSSGGGE